MIRAALAAVWPSLLLAPTAAHGTLEASGPAVMPGDRFREWYYWDSYWSLQGLVASGHDHAARVIFESFLDVALARGYIPNGGRTYYRNRSQPPVLGVTAEFMHRSWCSGGLEAEVEVEVGDDPFPPAPPSSSNPREMENDGDPGDDRTDETRKEHTRWIQTRVIPALEREYAYWTSGPHALTIRDDHGEEHEVSRYHAQWTSPRPESYLHDLSLVLARHQGRRLLDTPLHPLAQRDLRLPPICPGDEVSEVVEDDKEAELEGYEEIESAGVVEYIPGWSWTSDHLDNDDDGDEDSDGERSSSRLGSRLQCGCETAGYETWGCLGDVRQGWPATSDMSCREAWVAAASQLTPNEAEALLAEDDAVDLMRDVASAAESGWDFSSRWLLPGLRSLQSSQLSRYRHRDPRGDRPLEHEISPTTTSTTKTTKTTTTAPEASTPPTVPDLVDVATTRIIPTDLQVFLARLEWTLAQLFAHVEESHDQEADRTETVYVARAQRRVRTIHALFYVPHRHAWPDLVLERSRRDRSRSRSRFSGQGWRVGRRAVATATNGRAWRYASDLFPLWLSAAPTLRGHPPLAAGLGVSVGTSINALRDEMMNAARDLDRGRDDGDPTSSSRPPWVRASAWGPGGVAASNIASGEQWDYPNCWPPLLCVLAEGCAHGGGGDVAREIRTRAWESVRAGLAREGRGTGSGSGLGGWGRVVVPASVWEKYDCERAGKAGRGGEYPTGLGFGWTLGMALAWPGEEGGQEGDEETTR